MTLENALRLYGQPHLRPDADFSEGTCDRMYRCTIEGCPTGGHSRAVKITVADGLPVAADNWSTTCKGCGAELAPVTGSDQALDDPATVAALAADAAENVYTADEMIKAQAQLDAQRQAGEAAAAAAPDVPSTIDTE